MYHVVREIKRISVCLNACSEHTGENLHIKNWENKRNKMESKSDKKEMEMTIFFSGQKMKSLNSVDQTKNFEHFIIVNDQMNETSKNVITKFCNQMQQQQQQLRQIIRPSNYLILKQFDLFSSYFSFLLQWFFFPSLLVSSHIRYKLHVLLHIFIQFGIIDSLVRTYS